MAVKPPDPVVDEVVSREIVTIGQQMASIWQALTAQGQVTLQNVLGRTHSRIEIIVTLLAILELIKRRIIQVEQPDHFGDILIRKKDHGQELSAAEWEELTGLIDVS
jgi:segregation and condensation protein A